MVSLVYMVAGLSSRFGGRAKSFVEVGLNGETLIEVSINQALQSPFNNIVFIVSEKTESLFKEKFGDNYKGLPVKYAMQHFDPVERDKPWGTCDAIVSARDVVDNFFVVCNGDDLYGANSFAFLYNWSEWNSSPATLGYKLGEVVPDTGTVNRGIFKIDNQSIVTEINETLGIEKSKLSQFPLGPNSLTSQNIFMLSKNDLELLAEQLKHFKESHPADRMTECYLPVELSNLIKAGKIKMTLLSAPDRWIGITNPGDEEEVKKGIKRWYS